MPRADPSELAALELRARPLLGGYALHDVWRVELPDVGTVSIADLRASMTRSGAVTLPWVVRLLFAVRRGLGRLFGWDRDGGRSARTGIVAAVPEELSSASEVPPGTPEGPFTTLYRLPGEAAYHALNATVDALLVVALVPVGEGRRLYWATYLRPVGRITRLYMGLIDPFRRLFVYPGLERWLLRIGTRRR